MLTLALIAAPAAAQEPPLATVLERAGAYVADFHARLSSIVAEERYEQTWRDTWPSGGRKKPRIGQTRRTLLSDLLLVKPGTHAWMEFRDVFEVDGRPVRERDERLVKMFLNPSATTNDQIHMILEDSARFNIGDIDRNINTPIFPLMFLETGNRRRFKFKRTNERRPQTSDDGAAAGAFRVDTEVWVISYEETQIGTMIRTRGYQDLPVRGRFWVEPDTGRVLMSEISAETPIFRATIDVSYQSEPLLGVLVPIEMRERYDVKKSQSRVDGRATYGRFRQFQVTVDETLAPIKK